MARLTPDDVACWVLKTAGDVVVGEVSRCVRPSYRLGLMAPGQPCLLWRSGRHDPGVHALGVLTGGPRDGAVPVRLGRLTRMPASIGPAAGARRELASGGGQRGPLTLLAVGGAVRRRPRPDRSGPPGTMRG